MIKKVIIIYRFLPEKSNPEVFTTKTLAKGESEVIELCQKHEISDITRLDILKNMKEVFKRNKDFYEWSSDFFQVCIYNEDIWN